MNPEKETFLTVADTISEEIREISDFIHAHPEMGYKEFHAATRLKAFLSRHGFCVSDSLCGIETAFRADFETAQADSATPVFAVMAEYDALPGLGHACGHNLIAAAALFTVVMAAEVLRKQGIPAKIVCIGTPAEELYGGKIELVNAGAFHGIAAALLAHPFERNSSDFGALSVEHVRIAFHGRSSHAGFAPEKGINALDAMADFLVAARKLRESIPANERVHGIVTRGGDSPNIVPELTEASFYLRGPDDSAVAKLRERFLPIIERAATENRCTYETEFYLPYSSIRYNAPLNEAFRALWREDFSENLPVTDGTEGRGSTDVGNVSQVVPCAQVHFGITSGRAIPLHTEEFRACAASDEGFQQAKRISLVMAQIVTRFFSDPDFHNSVTLSF